MGRKLTSFEEAHSSFPFKEMNLDRGPVNSQHNQDLQHRIAKQLGVSVAQLGDPDLISNAADNENRSPQTAETASSGECLDLIKAFTRITDPNERLRCLRIVKAAAKIK